MTNQILSNKNIEFKIENFDNKSNDQQAIPTEFNINNDYEEEQDIKNKKPFYCKKCYFLLELSLKVEKNSEEVFINLFCRNNHNESYVISEFLQIYKSFQLDSFHCHKCKQNFKNTKYLLYCTTCNQVICLNCNIYHYKEHNKKKKE